ncbi:MAG: hypothetical protein LBB48_10195 [Treponema sp.]|jgi:TolB-like protein|nr:hypothetical protein [Treponema sp.]
MKKMIMVLVLLCAALTAYAQEKPRLGILPFTGGSGTDGDTVANLFSASEELKSTFRIVPRTSSVESVLREQEFQRSGLTDSDTIAELGKQMNANYVVSGHIARLGNANLLLISIIEVKTMRQITGDYREYRRVEDIPALLPSMAQNIVSSIQDGGAAPAKTLAVLPLQISDRTVKQDEAELLAQILATEIAKSGEYAVFPRTKTIESVLTELNIQQNSRMTDRQSMIAIGKATNAQYVLAGSISKLGNMNLFSVSILEIESAEQIEAAFKEYENLEDGIDIMSELSYMLTGVRAGRHRENMERAEAEQRQADREQQQREAEQKRVQQRREAERKKENWNSAFHDYLWRDGKTLAAIGLNLGASAFNSPLLFVNANLTIPVPFIPHLFIEGGVDFGFLSWWLSGRMNYTYTKTSYDYNYNQTTTKTYTDRIYYDVTGYSSWYPYARLNAFLPVSDSVGFYLGLGIGGMMETYEVESYYKYGDEEVPAKQTYDSFGFDIVAGGVLGGDHHLFRFGLVCNIMSPEDKSHPGFGGRDYIDQDTLIALRLMLGYAYRFK